LASVLSPTAIDLPARGPAGRYQLDLGADDLILDN